MKNYSVKIILLLLCLTTMAWAQPVTKTVKTNQQADLNWLMGNSEYWMVMNRGALGTVVMKGKKALGAGGSSVAGDATGKLLFYTDGQTVYDANHTACANCSGLEGNPAIAQPSAICELNSAGNLYAIFTNSGNEIRVSVVDMTGGLNITTKNQRVDLSGADGLITVTQPTATEPQATDLASYYAIYQRNFQSNTLQVVPVVPNTNNTFRSQEVPIDNLPANTVFTVKSFAYNEISRMLAIMPQTGPVILVKLGADASLTFIKTVPGSEAVSDCEFSLDGKYLYLSKTGTGKNDGGVFRCEVNSSAGLTSLLGATVINAGYDLQLAADGNIYHIYQASGSDNFLVARLTGVDEAANTDVKYSLKLNKNMIKIDNLGGWRFPSFLPPKYLTVTVDFEYAGKCTKSPVAFFPKTTPIADSVHWSFLGAAKRQPWSPVHRFKDSPGTVKMTAYYDGETVDVSKQIRLETPNLKLTLPQDTTACTCEFELGHRKNKNAIPPCTPRPFKLKVNAKDANGQAATPSYLWSTGATGAETTVDSVGYYYVVATDANGCSAIASTTVNEYGQNFNHYNFWFLGNGAWTDFTDRARKPPIVPLKNVMNAPEGCNLACDLMGNPIFYTDGKTVWDKKGNEVAHDIGGNESTQVEVVQVPKDTTLFYIFTPKLLNNGQYEMTYSLFDLKGTHLVNGVKEMGNVVSSNQPLFSNSTERIFHNEGWLVGHESDNNLFRAHQITDKGIGQPRTSSIGTVHSLPSMREGQIKVADTVLAVAVSKTATATEPASNQVDVFFFDNKIGLLSDYDKLDCGNEGQVYGVEISTDKERVFASVRNGANRGIHEFRIKYPATGERNTSRINLISDQGKELGAMSYGPDGNLYIAVNGGNSLGTINAGKTGKDASGAQTNTPSTFEPNGAKLPEGTSNWGLPTWKSEHSGNSKAPSVKVAPNPVCLGKEITFIATRSDRIDNITWDLDNKLGGNQFPDKDTVNYTYQAVGTYHPKLKLTNRCISGQKCDKTFIPPLTPDSPYTCSPNLDSVILKTEEVIIKKLKDLNIPLTGLCISTTVTLDANKNNLNGPSDDLEFLWEGGKGEVLGTASTLEITKVPSYINKVTVKDKQGCKAEQTDITIGDSRPQLMHLDDMQACLGAKADDLDVDPNGANANTFFQWKINEVNAGTAHNQPVETKVLGEYTYTVKATINDPDPDKRCVAIDTAAVTVNPLPKGYLPGRFIICNDPENHDPATSQVVLDAGQFTSYEWMLDGNTTEVKEQALTAKVPGNYQVTYTDKNGCKGTSKTNVVLDCVPHIVAPNAFRPESETEVNRTFSLHSFFITNDFQIVIFNRWGQKVFESKERNFKWNGGYQNEPGRPAPGDVYAYVVRYTGKYRPEEGMKEKRGGILLVR